MQRLLFAAALWAAGATAFAGTAYYPAMSSWGALLFEDQWSHTGDRDFNNLVLLHHYAFFDDDAGAPVDRRVLDPEVQAMGADRRGGLALRLPASASHVVSASLRVGTDTTAGIGAWGAPVALTVESDGGQPLMWLFDDLRADLCDGASGFIV